MANQVCSTGCVGCSFGMTPAPINVLPSNRVMSSSLPAGTIMSKNPMMNVPSFGMCQSIANPIVASATAAAMGVLTPMPCIPMIPAPWIPGDPRLLIGNMPALNNSSKLMCAYGGVISIQTAGQMTEQIG